MATVMRVFGVAFLVTLFGGSSAYAEDEVVGIVWEIKFELPNKQDQVTRFRATPDGKIWNAPKKGKPRQVGTWSGDQSNTKLNLTSPEKGTIEIVQVRKDPPGWQGIAIKENGQKRPCKIRLIKD